jgi:hypothetical protein
MTIQPDATNARRIDHMKAIVFLTTQLSGKSKNITEMARGANETFCGKQF